MKETKFKQTEVGMIPSDWEVKTLGSLTDKCSYGVGAEARVYCGDVKYIRITDIDDESHRFSPSPITSPSFFQEKHIVQKNDLLVARTGASVGKSYLYDEKDGKLVYAGFLMKLNVFNADSKYVFYNTLTKSYWNWVASESARTGQPGLNLQQMKLYSIALPPTIEEQQRIANALSDVDTLIANLEKLIAKKKNIKQGAMQQLLTGKKRLPGFAKSNNTKMTEVGEIPEDWEVKSVSSLLKIGHGKDYKNLKSGDVPVYGTGGYMTSVNQYLYDGETVCIGRKGTIDKPFYHEGKIWTVDTLFYTYDFENCIPKYIYYSFCLVDWLSMNEASGIPSLTSKNIEDVMLRIPSKEEQIAIANVLSSIDKEIETLNTKLEKYRNLKTAMMQQLLSGKIRLK